MLALFIVSCYWFVLISTVIESRSNHYPLGSVQLQKVAINQAAITTKSRSLTINDKFCGIDRNEQEKRVALLSIYGGNTDIDEEDEYSIPTSGIFSKLIFYIKQFFSFGKKSYKPQQKASKGKGKKNVEKKIEAQKKSVTKHSNNVKTSGSTSDKGKSDTTTTSSSSIASSGSGSANSRLQREIKSFLSNPPQFCSLTVNPRNIRSWQVTLTGPPESIYAGENYTLQMTFPKDYPTKPPAVYFLKPVPLHKHIYSNGDICLNLLGTGWRPILTAEGLAVSILSMLGSAKEKRLPENNNMHADNPPGKEQNWIYHDDKC